MDRRANLKRVTCLPNRWPKRRLPTKRCMLHIRPKLLQKKAFGGLQEAQRKNPSWVAPRIMRNGVVWYGMVPPP